MLSLLSEGYQLREQAGYADICILRHRRNGHTIRVVAHPLGVMVYKDGVLVKMDMV